MNFRRMLANAIARRIAYVLVAAALAWMGIGTARAQTYPTQAAAYSACLAHHDAYVGTNPVFAPGGCNNDPGPKRYICFIRLPTIGPGVTGACPDPTSFYYAEACSSRPNLTTGFSPKSGSVSCNAGCEMAWFRNGDGTSTATALGLACTNERMPTTCTGDFYWNPVLNVCEPTIPECKPGETLNSRNECAPETCPAGMVMGEDGTCTEKQNECPAGNIKAPTGECLPGEGQCAVGEARRANGTCGKDSDGDGQADEDDEDPENDPEKESASGGDNCSAPPSCSGGAIACMQVKIQWRIDCNTRRNVNVSGGSCSAIPVCTGDNCNAMEYSQLIQQWKTTCALERLSSSPGGDGDDELVSSGGVLGDDLDPDSVKGGGFDGAPEELSFDDSGFGWGGSCPDVPSVSLFGQTITFDTSVFCDWMRLGGVFVMVMAYLAGLAIVVRS